MNMSDAKTEMICEYCGKPFLVYKSDFKHRTPRFCSSKCYHMSTRVEPQTCFCEYCGKPFEKTPKKRRKRFCTVECACKWKRTRERKTIGKDGYVHVWQSDGGSVKEHIIIMERILGRKLKKGECVHHIDGNRHNNSPDNLQLMTIGEHSRLHRLKEMAEGKPLFGRVS